MCRLRLSLCVISEKPVVPLQIKRPCTQCLREWQSLLTPLKICQVSMTWIISADPVSQAQVTDKQSKSLYCWLAHTSHPSTGGTQQHTRHLMLDHYCNSKWRFHNIYSKSAISLYIQMRCFVCLFVIVESVLMCKSVLCKWHKIKSDVATIELTSLLVCCHSQACSTHCCICKPQPPNLDLYYFVFEEEQANARPVRLITTWPILDSNFWNPLYILLLVLFCSTIYVHLTELRFSIPF